MHPWVGRRSGLRRSSKVGLHHVVGLPGGRNEYGTLTLSGSLGVVVEAYLSGAAHMSRSTSAGVFVRVCPSDNSTRDRAADAILSSIIVARV